MKINDLFIFILFQITVFQKDCVLFIGRQIRITVSRITFSADTIIFYKFKYFIFQIPYIIILSINIDTFT